MRNASMWAVDGCTCSWLPHPRDLIADLQQGQALAEEPLILEDLLNGRAGLGARLEDAPHQLLGTIAQLKPIRERVLVCADELVGFLDVTP